MVLLCVRSQRAGGLVKVSYSIMFGRQIENERIIINTKMATTRAIPSQFRDMVNFIKDAHTIDYKDNPYFDVRTWWNSLMKMWRKMKSQKVAIVKGNTNRQD